MAGEVEPYQRRVALRWIAAGTIVAGALWYALYLWLPPPSGAEPLATAFACCALAGLLALVPGVEAVAHERLVTPAIDPLAGVETRRLRVNFRYLSNTLEQFVVFAAGLLALSAYAAPRILVIVAIVWVLARWAFWIGYHVSSLHRAVGAAGMMQSMIVLLYVGWRFGNDSYGAWAGFALLALFLAIEVLLFWAVKRPAQ